LTTAHHNRYISAPWYTQKQVVVPFQPKDTFYCVRAEYVPINSSNLLEGVDVKNYANRGAVNGPATGTSGSGGIGSFPGRFIATVPNSNDTSKLSVGFAAPGTTMQIFGAPYWVVGIAPDYSWAIITGGPPESPGANGGCTTAGPMGDSGFWLFARKPVDPVAVAAMETEAKKLGLDTSVLLPVAQEGCKYESA